MNNHKSFHRTTKLKKEYDEVNLFVPWSITVGLVFFIVFVYFIWIIEFDIFRNPNLITDNHLRYGLLILAFFLTIAIIRALNKLIAGHINKSYQSKFHHIKDINAYAESIEKSFFTEKKYEHVVLLLHGFSASTQEFQFLISDLKENSINYYVLNLVGFGLDNTMLLNNTKRQDWYRTCLSIYDSLSRISHKVSIVGHSMGGVLAAYIAENRKVHHLILTSPGFYPTKEHYLHKKLLTTPIISFLYTMFIPYMPKPLKKRVNIHQSPDYKRFHYLAVPVASIREVFFMQEESHINKMQFYSLSIIYGQYEETVDINKLFKYLDIYNVTYTPYYMKNSAHNVLEDFEYKECCKLVTDILLDKTPINNTF